MSGGKLKVPMVLRTTMAQAGVRRRSIRNRSTPGSAIFPV